jgi:hypothetical protein
MKTSILETNEAPNKWWAAQDARQRNLNNKSHYPEFIKRQIDRMILVLPEVYSARGIYDAYGKRGVSIKIDQARVRDNKTLAWLEEQWTTMGFVKKVSDQGVIYRRAV